MNARRRRSRVGTTAGSGISLDKEGRTIMGASATGGLSGKERRKHEFGRASRRFADHLIADYFNAEEEVERAQRIPIKRCSAYLSSGDGAAASAKRPVEAQARLDFDTPARAERPGAREVVWPPVHTSEPPRRKLIDETQVTLTRERTPVRENAPSAVATKPERAIRFAAQPPAATPTGLPFPREWRPPMGYKSSKPRSSVRGFAYGCLIGGAVAASLLIALSLLVR